MPRPSARVHLYLAPQLAGDERPFLAAVLRNQRAQVLVLLRKRRGGGGGALAKLSEISDLPLLNFVYN